MRGGAGAGTAAALLFPSTSVRVARLLGVHREPHQQAQAVDHVDPLRVLVAAAAGAGAASTCP